MIALSRNQVRNVCTEFNLPNCVVQHSCEVVIDQSAWTRPRLAPHSSVGCGGSGGSGGSTLLVESGDVLTE
jgi:hypothetical protein